ncbi:MAG: hypothetical protein R3E79_29135, partial [Caldilineaceae bacterium]
GGMGKTSLAIEAAKLTDFRNGVWLVELAAIHDADFVAQTLVATFALPEMAERMPLHALITYLQHKHLLLLLDNCEHLIQACAELAEALLRACPELHILATSREGLGVAGEVTWSVPSLQLPDAETQLTLSELATFEAVRLFIDRAALVLPGFTLTAANGETVRQICTRLDGIPLAIELAAARMKTLSVTEIATRLQDRFRLLTGGSRTVLPRHQTLWALIDWSYQLLTEAERSVLRCLAIFIGGWTLDAAEVICAGGDIHGQDVLDVLTRLVDKSLVVVDTHSEPRRYTLLETIRQYVAERLEDTKESTAVRNRHLNYFLTLGERFAPQLWGEHVAVDQAALVTRLASDLDNIRAALDWATETERIDEGLCLLLTIADLFVVRAKPKELLARLRAMLNHPTPPHDVHTYVQACLVIVEHDHRLGAVDLGRTWLEKAEVMSANVDEPGLHGWILTSWYSNAMLSGDYALAHSYLEQWRTLAASHDHFGISAEDFTAGWAWLYGQLLLAEGDYRQAKQQLRLSHTRAVQCGFLLASTARARALGYALLYSGDVAEAADHFQESLMGNFALGAKQAVAACLAAWAAYALVQGDLQRAARLFGASEGLQEALYTRLMDWDVKQVQRAIEILRQQLPAPALHEHWSAGRTLSLEKAMNDALQAAESLPS